MSAVSVICDRLADAGVEVVASLPDTWVMHLIAAVKKDSRFFHVSVNREEAAIGVCTGAFFAGKGSAAIMGTSGFHASIFAITKINFTYQIGTPILMNLRGAPGDMSSHHVSNGLYTIPLFETLNIPYEVLDTPQSLDRIPKLVHNARLVKRPVAICLDRDLLL